MHIYILLYVYTYIYKNVQEMFVPNSENIKQQLNTNEPLKT